MKAIDEPPYLTVGTDVSAKYRGAFCEAKIKTTKRLVKVKVTFRHDSSTVEIQDEHVKGPLKVGAVVEVKNSDGTCHEAVINKLTDASWYTVVFDDGDEKTLRRSSLCLKGGRHFAESETLDQLPLTNPEHFGTPVIGKKINRGRRSNHIPEEESSSTSSEEDEDDKNQTDELLGKIVSVDCVSADRKRGTWFPALVVSSDCSDEIIVKKDSILVRSFSDGKFVSVPRKDVRVISSELASDPDTTLKQALEQAFQFHKSKAIPNIWKTELKEESSSSETEDEEEADQEDSSSSEEEEEIEPFPEERENFMQQLYKFMEDRGTTINKRPVLGYRNLNLFKLFRLVHKLGGFDNIESGAVWKQVYQDLGIPVLNTAAGYNVKCAYKKYLYGFEEYCRSANIKFHMVLPEKVSSKPYKESKNENGLEVHLKHEPHVKDLKMDKDVVLAKEQLMEQERRENEIKTSRERKKNVQESVHSESDNETEPNQLKQETDDSLEEKTIEIMKDIEPSPNNEELSEEREESGDELNDNDDDDDGDDDDDDDADEKEEDEKKEDGEGEEFECYPPGLKVQVRYGRGKNQKLYEASIKDSDVEGGEVLYLVHYSGWNVRYDEWIKADKIVRPADKNVPKIKHRKKIKNKIEKEKKLEKDEICLSKNCKTICFPKPSLHTITSKSKCKLEICDTKISEQDPVTAVEISSIPNGLQASESSTEDSEHECDQTFQNTDNGEEAEGQNDSLDQSKNAPSPKEKSTFSFLDENAAHSNKIICSIASRSSDDFRQEMSEDFDSKEKKETTSRRKERRKEAMEKVTKSQVKCGKRSYYNSDDCLQASSLCRKDEKSRGKQRFIRLINSSSSGSDEEEEEKMKPKMTPLKKYSRLEERRKSLRTTGFYSSFSDIPDKRLRLINNSDERLQNARAKDRKDVWSSIQGQWPKKTLKELFSDSDTEAAASPSHDPPEEVTRELLMHTIKEEISLSTCDLKTPLQAGVDGKYVEEKRIEMGDKKAEFPSSGSNSVLNTPPTTPESPASAAESNRQQTTHVLAISETQAQNQEEVQSIKSETDSTIEVDSVAGELQDLPSEGNLSPTGFDASISSSSSNQLEAEHKGVIKGDLGKFVSLNLSLLD
ncbi:AT-rich interactive domain-containing protein 4B isoform X2 [Microcaecilia unicolor]|uniref:AT-rich interactive domain-containing protein 4B n=1 Tax=Microcaecilia unicolor TaxID=1415580 RepID=A0A6P7XN76_9AMPH|nr:AT-rich interactive domain-containing protein 4B isoform X2 [Microcaecilia unicolor]